MWNHVENCGVLLNSLSEKQKVAQKGDLTLHKKEGVFFL
jgi:hypothetical protein